MIDRKELKAKRCMCIISRECTLTHIAYTPLCRLEGEEQQGLTDSAVSIDPEYNILWSYSTDTNKVSCFNPIAANIEGMMLR